jgi:hypothetical protein
LYRKGNALPAQTILGQTVLLAFRIALVWAGGILFAVIVRAVLPDNLGFNIHLKDGGLLLPFSRVAFWTCIWAAVTVTVLVVIRSMIIDFGIQPRP